MKQRADGRWLVARTINGKRINFYSKESTEAKAKKDIEKQMLLYQEKEQLGKFFSEVADEWEKEYRETVPDISYRKNQKRKLETAKEFFGNKRIKDITAREISVYIANLAKKGYYKKTIADYKCVLNMIFRHAILNGYINYNPTADIRLPSNLQHTKRVIPSTEDIRAVAEHTQGFALLPYFILNTGCRKSEALAIKRENINFKTKRLTISHHLIHDGNTPIYEPVLKTDAAEREIVLPDRLLKVIPKNFKGFLFSMEEDGKKPLTKKAFDLRWKKYCQEYNIHFTAHQLRHAYATMLHEAGVDVKDAQVLMGHSDITLTKQIYTHIREERMKETEDKINNFSF